MSGSRTDFCECEGCCDLAVSVDVQDGTVEVDALEVVSASSECMCCSHPIPPLPEARSTLVVSAWHAHPSPILDLHAALHEHAAATRPGPPSAQSRWLAIEASIWAGRDSDQLIAAASLHSSSVAFVNHMYLLPNLVSVVVAHTKNRIGKVHASLVVIRLGSASLLKPLLPICG